MQTYLDPEDELPPGKRWGKTLVFAGTIDHANSLYKSFRDDIVPVKVLHSDVDDKDEPLTWFRNQEGDAVLVSVGMLTEGVDVPDAQTVFLARPTRSRILLKQMIGRALRGPKAGGANLAYIVSFKDYWDRFTGILDASDVSELPMHQIDRLTGDVYRLPSLEVSGKTIPSDVQAHLKRIYRKMEITHAVFRPALVGWYNLEDCRIAVLKHQVDAFEEFIDAAAESLKGRPMNSFFDGLPLPHPDTRDLADIRDYIRAFGQRPELESVNDDSSPAAVAKKIREAPTLSDDERATIVETAFKKGAAQVIWQNLDAYEQAVEHEVRLLRGNRKTYDGVLRLNQYHGRKRRLRPSHDRDSDLRQAKKTVLGWIEENLDDVYKERLEWDIAVGWSHNVVSSYFGVWTYKRTGRNAGAAKITVNRWLRTRPSIVSNEMLEFVIYHEILHDLLPFQMHSPLFRQLEAKWPGIDDIEARLHTLGEKWEMRSECYRNRRNS